MSLMAAIFHGVSQPSVIFYDFDHCRDFLEARTRDLQQSARGLDTLATLRELYYGFSYEALEQNAIILGQFDTGVVYVFLPFTFSGENSTRALELAENKAVELLGANEPPVVMELLDAQIQTEDFNSRAGMQTWMREEFLREVVLEGKIRIILFFNGGGFFEEVMRPQLVKHGFQLLDPYSESAESGELRVKHNSTASRVYRIPWVTWVREMMSGGYNIVYLMACFSAYLDKLQTAVRA
jgi:hypothetical protein